MPKRVVFRAYRYLIRDPRRKRILNQLADLPPCPPLPEDSPSVSFHSLLCQRDIDMGICAFKSLVLAVGKPLYFVFHDDGSLKKEHINRLQMHFPGARVVSREESNAYFSDHLKDYPNALRWRENQVLALKLLDIWAFSSSPRIAYVDSDILFFREPLFFTRQLFGEAGPNYFNRDPKNSYVLPVEYIKEHFGVTILDRINAGLAAWNRDDINIELVEKWLGNKYTKNVLSMYLLEQTFVAMLASRSFLGARHLPEAYDVSFEKPVEQSVCKHYVGRIRHGFELEGLQYLLKNLNFIDRWHSFTRNVPTDLM